jgi:hypothetical protein
MNYVQITDVKDGPQILAWKRPPSVIRVVRRKRKGPGPAIYKPLSKWTVVAAFILSIALHLAAVAIVEMNSEQPRTALNQNLDDSAPPNSVD